MTTVTPKRKELPDGGATVKPFAQAIAESLARLQSAHGGKALAAHFDGREGREVACSTVSRWISEPTRFPAVFVPVLAELDPAFRAYVVRSLFTSELVAAVQDPHALGKDAEALRRKLERQFLDLAYGPGRMGERYA